MPVPIPGSKVGSDTQKVKFLTIFGRPETRFFCQISGVPCGVKFSVPLPAVRFCPVRSEGSIALPAPPLSSGFAAPSRCARTRSTVSFIVYFGTPSLSRSCGKPTPYPWHLNQGYLAPVVAGVWLHTLTPTEGQLEFWMDHTYWSGSAISCIAFQFQLATHVL